MCTHTHTTTAILHYTKAVLKRQCAALSQQPQHVTDSALKGQRVYFWPSALKHSSAAGNTHATCGCGAHAAQAKADSQIKPLILGKWYIITIYFIEH